MEVKTQQPKKVGAGSVPATDKPYKSVTQP